MQHRLLTSQLQLLRIGNGGGHFIGKSNSSMHIIGTWDSYRLGIT